MKAELTDGRIISLDGPCEVGCVTHTGPHWLHMDAYDQCKNIELLAMAEHQRETARNPTEYLKISVYLRRFAEHEIARLDRKKQQMQAAGIVRLIEDAA